MFFFNPDRNGSQLGQHVSRDEDADSLEMICEDGDCALVFAVLRSVEQGWVDENGPTFDGAFDGVESRGVWFFVGRWFSGSTDGVTDEHATDGD